MKLLLNDLIYITTTRNAISNLWENSSLQNFSGPDSQLSESPAEKLTCLTRSFKVASLHEKQQTTNRFQILILHPIKAWLAQKHRNGWVNFKCQKNFMEYCISYQRILKGWEYNPKFEPLDKQYS